jgi:NifU-like protein
MWEYSEKVKDHFFQPRNVGILEGANAVGDVGSLACGDALKLYLKIDPETEKILDASFQTFGCGSAIASSSALTEMLKGKTVEDALKITNQDIADYLGGLPKEKMHCSVRERDALHAAIGCYRGESAPDDAIEGELVCECFGVTDEAIRSAVRENNLSTIQEVTDYTKAGGGCGLCHEKIERIISEVQEQKRGGESMSSRVHRPMTNIQKIAKIQDVLDKEIRPSLQQDGGDIELIDLDGDVVKIALRGLCSSCPSSALTKAGIETKIRELVYPTLTVEEVSV